MNADTKLATTTAPMSFERYAECENTLMQQKNLLLERINDASETEHFADILDTLRFVAPMWQAMQYTYKLNEVLSRIIDAMYKYLDIAKQLRDTSRKNSTQRRLWDLDCKRYNDLIADACIMRA